MSELTVNLEPLERCRDEWLLNEPAWPKIDMGIWWNGPFFEDDPGACDTCCCVAGWIRVRYADQVDQYVLDWHPDEPYDESDDALVVSQWMAPNDHRVRTRIFDFFYIGRRYFVDVDPDEVRYFCVTKQQTAAALERLLADLRKVIR